MTGAKISLPSADTSCRSEVRAWVVAAGSILLAWSMALVSVWLQSGPMVDPDEFAPGPPLSVLVTGLILVPGTCVFLLGAAGRGLYLMAVVGLKSGQPRRLRRSKLD